MKRITIITLAMAIGIVLFQPTPTLAKDQKDQDQTEKGQGKKEKTQGKSGGRAANPEQTSQQPRSSAILGRSKGNISHSDNVSITPSNAAGGRSRGSRAVPTQTVTAPSSRFQQSTTRDLQRSRFSGRGQNNPSFSNQSSYNRSNNYGGLWVYGDTHRDWDRNRVHFWNHHRYGWYDDGWLIIDGGFRPPSYSDYGYSGGSSVSRVQRRLAEEGYYRGSADGIIGPVTRNAIADYQRDYRLAVTGRINDSLLVSLGLE